ncbi:MAG TPA: hypothetical protein VGA05_08530 [Candidatus Bathyarchaeia archaeon]
MNDPVLEALNRSAEEVTPQDIDQIIAYLRKSKKDFESGAKPKKKGGIDLMKALNIGVAKTTPGFVRRG